MVLMDAPAHVGCLIEIRILGVIEAEQTEDGKTERNDRLLGVAVHSFDHQELDSINDVSKTLLDQVEAFFVSYNIQRGKKFKVIAVARRDNSTAIEVKAQAFVSRQIRLIYCRPIQLGGQNEVLSCGGDYQHSPVVCEACLGTAKSDGSECP